MKSFNAEDYLIFSAVTGSRLYGTSNEDSDLDVRAVCLPPLEVLLNPFESFKVADSFEGEDKAIYSLGKFLELCANANPNIVELLFIPESHIIVGSKVWDKVLENRHWFISKKVKHTFTGYAFSQIKAIERHRRWFINPPSKKPERKYFGLGSVPIISESHLQNALSLPPDMFKDSYIDEVRREKEYRDAKRDWDNYQSYLENRNPKRKEMEQRFGYDGKFASHVFRLMTEGKQLLLTGEIKFPLENAEWLLAIRDGFYEYDEILKMAKDMEKDFDTWYEQSQLPKTPDRNSIKEMYFDILLNR